MVLGPDPRSSPANKTIVAGRVRTEVIRQVSPWRPRSQDPEDAIEDATVIHSWHAARLIRQHRLDRRPLIVCEFVAHDFGPLSVRDLNHFLAVGLNMPGQGAGGRDAQKADLLSLRRVLKRLTRFDPRQPPSITWRECSLSMQFRLRMPPDRRKPCCHRTS